MELRRNPYRKCKIEEALEVSIINQEDRKRRRSCTVEIPPMRPPTKIQRTLQYVYVLAMKLYRVLTIAGSKALHTPASPQTRSGPFPFANLPREIRDQVLSYLVVRRGRKMPILEAKVIIRDQKKRAAQLKTREKQNAKRAQSGRPAIAHRDGPPEHIVHLDAMSASRQLYYEAKDCFYQSNYFAISLDNFPATTFDTPSGWDCSRIKKMQLELQLKDAHRMNSYVDWSSFFAKFPSLVHLRIVPTFHSRYYEWARMELEDWRSAHFVFRAFFRELLACTPEHVIWKLGPSSDPQRDMHIEGTAHVSKHLLWDMYTELAPRMGLRRPASMIIDTPANGGVDLRLASTLMAR